MIVFDRIQVRYPRSAVLAVDGVSAEATRGRITAIVGPNGSGKSTLVRALLRRAPLDGGHITVDGTDVQQLSMADLARRVAVIPQREEVAFPIAVREYVALGRYPHIGRWRSPSVEDHRAIDEAMALAEVGELADRRVDALSGGEWQRARLARALAQGGDAVVLDEPTTFLDIAHEMGVFELLHTLAARGRAILLVSHQLNLVARFAQHIVLLHRGHVAAHGTPAEVMRASVLEPVYEWPLVVTRDPAIGVPALLPLRGRGR